MKIKRYIELKPEYRERYLATYKSWEGALKEDEKWKKIFDPKYYIHTLRDVDAGQEQ